MKPGSYMERNILADCVIDDPAKLHDAISTEKLQKALLDTFGDAIAGIKVVPGTMTVEMKPDRVVTYMPTTVLLMGDQERATLRERILAKVKELVAKGEMLA